MTLADDLAALIAAREAATTVNGVESFTVLSYEFIEAHGAELAALVAENARLRAALEGYLREYDATERPNWGGRVYYGVEALRAALRGPSSVTPPDFGVSVIHEGWPPSEVRRDTASEAIPRGRGTRSRAPSLPYRGLSRGDYPRGARVMADRGAAALAERLHIVRPRVCPSSEPHTPTARRHTDDALDILGDRGVYLPDGLDAARLRTTIRDRFDDVGWGEEFASTIALAVDDILADLGVPMTDTVGGTKRTGP